MTYSRVPKPRDINKNKAGIPANLTPLGTRCIPVNVPDDVEYISLFLGALARLSKQSLYDRDAAHSAKVVASTWDAVYQETLLNVLNGVTCEDISGTDSCSDHIPDSVFISYTPNNPYTTPDLTPDGYSLPPFYTNPSIPLPGVLPSDAMVNFAAIVNLTLPGLIASGLPRYRVSFSGTGRIELAHVKVPQGGLIAITTDGNPLSAQVVDLNSISLIGLDTILDIFTNITDATEEVEIITRHDFTVAGSHYIDVTFLPNVSLDVILGFGGGLRKVTTCGNIVLATDAPSDFCDETSDTMIRQKPDEPCIIQTSTDGETWVDTIDLLMCAPIISTSFQGLNIGYHTPEGFTKFRVPDGSWIDQPVTDWFNDMVPTHAMTVQSNDKCNAAANAANVLRQLFYGIQNSFLSNVVGVALSPSFALESALSLFVTSTIEAAALLAEITFFVAYQAIFNGTVFSDADYRRLVCLINSNMTGTAGNWTIDYAAVSSGLATSGIYANLVLCLLQELNNIGANGLNLAAKTTAITSYSCAAVSADMFDFTQTFSSYVNANNQLIQWATEKHTQANPSLMRFRVLGQHFSGTDGMGGDNTAALPAGRDASVAPGPGFITGSKNDVWLRNPGVYSTNALSLAAIRLIMKDPTYTPDNNQAASGTWNVNGIWPYHRWKVTPLGTSVSLVVQVDYYYHVSFAACP